MKLRYLTRPILFFLLALAYFSTYSQVPGPEILNSNREALGKAHEENFGNIRDVISGREHRAIYHYTIGHPFWKQRSWMLGDIQTNIHFYPSLTIRYDLYKDVLLYLPDSLYVEFLAVNQDQVLHFTLEDVPFINLGLGEEWEDMQEAKMEPGYYEILYQGKTHLFAKNWKELKNKSGDANAHSEFYDRRTLHLYVDDVFHLIKRKKSLLLALEPHKNEIRVFLRQKHINMRRINDLQFVNLLRYYDSL